MFSFSFKLSMLNFWVSKNMIYSNFLGCHWPIQDYILRPKDMFRTEELPRNLKRKPPPWNWQLARKTIRLPVRVGLGPICRGELFVLGSLTVQFATQAAMMMSMSINFCDGKFYGCRVQGGWNSRWYVSGWWSNWYSNTFKKRTF